MNKTKNQLISEELALAGEASGLSPTLLDLEKNRIIPLFHRVAGSDETFPEDMFDIFNVRNVDRDKREDYLFAAIEYYKPDLVILDGIQCLPHMKPTIILETSYKDVGNMMWWGFRNAPRFKSQKALYLLLSGAERSKHNIFLFILSSLRWKAAKPSALAQRTKQETSYSGQS